MSDIEIGKIVVTVNNDSPDSVMAALVMAGQIEFEF